MGLRRFHVDPILLSTVFLSLVGIGQFVYCVPKSMKLYAGGSIHQQELHGYSWNQNWISDLGRTKAWNGQSNRRCAALFNWSTIALGITLALFFAMTLRAFEETNLLGVVTAVAGTVSACGLVGIGLTPFDLFHQLHIAALLLWILPMLVVAFSFSVQTIRSEGPLGWVVAASSVVLIAVAAAYAFSASTDQVMAIQKLVVLLSICWFAIIALRVALTAIYVMVETRTRWQLVNTQADQYMRKIEKGYLMPYRREDEP